MPKTTFLKVRLDAVEMLEIERQARTLNLPKSRLARLLLTGGAVAKPEQSAPAAAPVFDDSRLAAVEDRLAEIDGSLAASARAFDTLLQQLAEFLRVPTFREYRARLHAEGIEKRQNEDDAQFLVRVAQRYFIAFSVWPNPADSRVFGPLPQNFEAAKFPRTPPA